MPPKRNTPKGGNSSAAAKQQDNAAATSTGASAAAVAAAFSEATSSTPVHLLLRGKNDIKIATISRSYLPGPTTTTSQPDGAVVESATLEHSYMTIADGGVTISDNLIDGPDCSECEAIVCKTYPFAIVATAADVQVVPLAAHLSASGNKSSSNVVIPEQKIVKMQVSPMERYLVLYRAQNPNDPTQAGGNMIVYRLNLDAPTPSVQLVMRCVQSAWPAFRFTQDETYAVRYVRGLLVLHDVTKDFAVCGDASQVEDADEGGAESDEDATATTKDAAAPKRALCNLNAGVAKGKELVMSLPTHGVKTDSSSGNTLAVFRPFTNNARKRGGAVGGGVNPGAASLVLYRLPQLQNPGLMAVPLHQAEDVALEWSPDGGNYLCVWIKLDSSAAGGGGGSDYYGKTYLYLIDVRLKKEMLIKFPSAGGAPSAIVSPGFSSLAGSQPVHDVKWCPSPSFYRDCATVANHPSKSSTQFFVAIHGEMPHSEATLFNERGQALYRFGRSACNVVHWSPNGAFAAFGGFGNLAGDVRICYNGEAVAQYYNSRDGANKKASSSGNNNGRKPAAASAIAPPPVSPQVGTLSDKTSEQSWSPDSRLYMTSTLFGKLRTSNKIALYKHNGEKLFEKRYTAPPIPNANPDLAPTIADDAKLFQATWLPVSYSAASGDEDDNEDVAFETLGRSPASFPPPSPRMPASVYSKCSVVIEAAAKAASGAAGGGAGAAAAAPPKVGLFKARGGGSATVAAAMSKGAVGGGTVKAAVPVGGNVVEKKKKKR